MKIQMNSKLLGSWELYRKGSNGILEFRKAESVFQNKSKNFIVFTRKDNQFNDFLLFKTSNGRLNPIKAQCRVIGNEIHIYFDDSYQDVILKIKKNDGKILEVIDITNGLGLE
jgi:hypothetical protein